VTDEDGRKQVIQKGTLGELLTPGYWLERLRRTGSRCRDGVAVGTIPMVAGVDQFAARWRVELRDPRSGSAVACEYAVRRLPEPVG